MSETKENKNITDNRVLLLAVLLNLAGICYYLYFLNINKYLPSPFLYNKSDSFMDLFNTIYWAGDNGRYTDWKSVYPPFSFYIVKCINSICGVAYQDDSVSIRDQSLNVIIGFIIIYFTSSLLAIKHKAFNCFSSVQKITLYLIFVSSTPMLFALERGNIIVLCPLILIYALYSKGNVRHLCIALLINIKPYFALLMLYYVYKKEWSGMSRAIVLSGFIFVGFGMLLDDNFLLFFENLLFFSKSEDLFSMRELMALPTSISAFSAILKTQDGAAFISTFIQATSPEFLTTVIEYTKYFFLVGLTMMLFNKLSFIDEYTIFISLITMLTNIGTWVGGYSIIFYIALIPAFVKMKYCKIYILIVILLAAPLDIFTILSNNIGEQYSFVSDEVVLVEWTLGAGSLLRPILNMLLLLTVLFEVAKAGSNKEYCINTKAISNCEGGINDFKCI